MSQRTESRLVDAKNLANARGEVDELERTAGGFRGDVETHAGADAHRVHVADVGEVEDDLLAAGEKLADAGGKGVGDAGDDPTVTLDGDDVAVALDVEG